MSIDNVLRPGEIGQTVSHYRILEKLGEGGMGEVYLAKGAEVETAPQLSADGKKLLYLKKYLVGYIWIAKSDGSGARQITFDERFLRDPRLSPDGLRLLFPVQLSNQSLENARPSYDGEEIAYAEQRFKESWRSLKILLSRAGFGLLDVSWRSFTLFVRKM